MRSSGPAFPASAEAEGRRVLKIEFIEIVVGSYHQEQEAGDQELAQCLHYGCPTGLRCRATAPSQPHEGAMEIDPRPGAQGLRCGALQAG
ncbi:MAG: hypothetical protein ACYDHX_17335 [Methanothrix sp.]